MHYLINSLLLLLCWMKYLEYSRLSEWVKSWSGGGQSGESGDGQIQGMHVCPCLDMSVCLSVSPICLSVCLCSVM